MVGPFCVKRTIPSLVIAPQTLRGARLPDNSGRHERDKNPGMDQTVKLQPPIEDFVLDDHQPTGHISRSGAYLQIAVGVIIFLGLYITSLYSYLLFHSLAEAFSVVIGCSIFVIAWNARGFLKTNYLLFLGIAYLFVACFDFVHTLAYKGMGVFPSYDANLPTQLWIASRYLQSASLLIAPLFLARRLRLGPVFIAFSLVSVIVLGAIFYWNIFPDCYVEGLGLTPFKKISEYVICLLLVASLILLTKLRHRFERNVFLLLAWSIGVTVGSELAFTFYVSVYGFSNLVGHFLKIIAFYLIYKAIIETGLRRPYDILFRELKEKQDILEQEKKALQESEERYRLLVDLSPDGICMYTRGRYVFANKSMATILGLQTPEELIGTQHLDLIHPQYRELVKERMAAVLTQDMTVAMVEEKVIRSDGAVVDVEVAAAPISYRGQPAGLAVIRDITARKQAEEKREQLLVELQDALAEVKKLSGFLPICASCKKIRDDKGYWQQIERYISDHSEAQFSHGICPECARKLYPEMFHDE